MTSSAPIRFQLAKRAEWTSALTESMYALLTEHFEGGTETQFARDLEEKNLALLLYRDERLVGFSTLLAYATHFQAAPLNVLYSGDTIVTPDAWGTTALPRAWVAGVESLRATLPPGRCVWLLLTSGFRTYRFLPVFWREFYPRHDRLTPPASQQLLDHLADARFGPRFDAAKGIVRLTHPQRLRAGLQIVPPGRERDPHTRFFLRRNPGHADGDELVCLTDLSPQNLTPAGQRIVRSLSHELAGHAC